MATFNNTAVDATVFSTSNIITVWPSDAGDTVFAFGTERMGPDGHVMPGPEAAPTYTMRAYKTTPTTGHVYWEVDEPDLTGQRSGYSPADLIDIVVYHQCCTPSAKEG